MGVLRAWSRTLRTSVKALLEIIAYGVQTHLRKHFDQNDYRPAIWRKTPKEVWDENNHWATIRDPDQEYMQRRRKRRLEVRDIIQGGFRIVQQWGIKEWLRCTT